jgi:hypothetical protein
MVDATHHTEAPAEWLDALAESEAQLAAGQTVSGEAVRDKLREAIARLEARQATAPRVSRDAVGIAAKRIRETRRESD